ncbi:MAG TPA: SDR family oxidoreductase [Chloroflexaceae bacterium]|nr:SDR family oxidoreductase [Chloroflexaceae bacterium]
MSPDTLLPRLRGLHDDKVALITGGSVGIGAALGRLLALSGARVLLAARTPGPLEALRARIVAELEAAGYPEPASRVAIEPHCDVGNPADVERLAFRALTTFGHVDYLINNAGVVGCEDMVIDMPVDGWRRCLQANMNSNYALIRALAPQMKRRGAGHIVNVSSYFGGEKYVAIAYPNRADYAVSKAGQRALVEAMARFLGPEVQVNAIAPGPVDGDRLRGTASRPSMFQRRARVILENRRLSAVHAALLAAHREGGLPVGDALAAVLANDVEAVLGDERQPAALRRLAAQIWAQSDPAGASRAHFLGERLAGKLLRRLANAGLLAADAPSACILHPASFPAEPFFTQAEYEREGAKVGERILGMLHLRRVPANDDVALALVYQLADRFVTGETFHTSGGLRFERAVTEGELFGKANPLRLVQLRGSTVYLVGEHLREHLATLVHTYLDQQGAARVVLLTETAATAERLRAPFEHHVAGGRLAVVVTGGDLEGGLDEARSRYGPADAVVSTPFRPLPQARLAAPADGDWEAVLSAEGFVELVEQQLTHHMRVAGRVAAMDGARLVLVTPPTTRRSSEEEFALANFVKTTLHAFTATFGAECERVAHHTAVNQVDLTRRSRDEEPQTVEEEEEELERFVEAVLLTSVPLPGPNESRYRARIYRGNAITV